MSPTVDAGRLAAELETLAGLSSDTPPAVTRIAFTDADLRARAGCERVDDRLELLRIANPTR